MTEASEVKPAAEHVEILSAEVRRTLLLIRGRSGLLEEPLNEFIVANQRQFGRDTDDYASMVLAHQTNTFPGSKENEIYLGIHEEFEIMCSFLQPKRRGRKSMKVELH